MARIDLPCMQDKEDSLVINIKAGGVLFAVNEHLDYSHVFLSKENAQKAVDFLTAHLKAEEQKTSPDFEMPLESFDDPVLELSCGVIPTDKLYVHPRADGAFYVQIKNENGDALDVRLKAEEAIALAAFITQYCSAK